MRKVYVIYYFLISVRIIFILMPQQECEVLQHMKLYFSFKDFVLMWHRKFFPDLFVVRMIVGRHGDGICITEQIEKVQVLLL